MKFYSIRLSSPELFGNPVLAEPDCCGTVFLLAGCSLWQPPPSEISTGVGSSKTSLVTRDPEEPLDLLHYVHSGWQQSDSASNLLGPQEREQRLVELFRHFEMDQVAAAFEHFDTGI